MDELTKPQQRKLSLAMSLVGKSKLLFFDEPTTGLDLESKQQFWDLVKGGMGRKVTIIVSTNSINEANMVADRICIMSQGKVVAIDTP